MSNNSSPRGKRVKPRFDKRINRTRIALAEALMALGPARGVDNLDVRSLTAKAGVGRSTFYKHYADKDDFFIKSFAGMVEARDSHARAYRRDYDTMLPAHEVFQHVEEARAFAKSLVESGQFGRTIAAREDVLRRIAEGNLKRLHPNWPASRRQETAVVLASTFAGLMRWWMEDGVRKDATYVAGLYDAIARRVLQS
ncbi:MAG: TetR family transcriptional regulator [Alphaproteobacteria bacterium]|nr:TetR family transcriptional regulator [Alphaproteobacteria bacterium]